MIQTMIDSLGLFQKDLIQAISFDSKIIRNWIGFGYS